MSELWIKQEFEPIKGDSFPTAAVICALVLKFGDADFTEYELEDARRRASEIQITQRTAVPPDQPMISIQVQ